MRFPWQRRRERIDDAQSEWDRAHDARLGEAEERAERPLRRAAEVEAVARRRDGQNHWTESVLRAVQGGAHG